MYFCCSTIKLKAPSQDAKESSKYVFHIRKDPVMFGPNIIGHSELDTTVDGNSLIFLASGAFSREVVQASGGYAAYQSVLTVQRHGNFDFDASNSNAIFGKSSVVQPSSIRLLPCIKI